MRTDLVALALIVGCKGSETAAPTAPSSTALPSSSAIPSASSAPIADAASSARKGSNEWPFDFDGDTAGTLPVGFTAARTGGNRDGNWVVHVESDAPSKPNVVAQTDIDPSDGRFALLYANEPVLTDASVSVRCKPVSGSVDRACGLVCRLKDANNYYLARANALENNVRLYVVQDGKRKQLASWSGRVTSGEWHKLSLICHADLFTVSFDGQKAITQLDKTFADAGKIGLWTKSDSVTYFDDLTVKQAGF